MFRPTLLVLGLMAVGLSHAATATDELRAELARQRQLIEQQQLRLDAMADTLEQRPSANAGLNNGATTLGMYGEVHYNNLSSNDPAESRSNFHAHRVVLLVGHEFSSDVKFYSELEFEGAADSTDIETEVEQFFVNWTLNEKLSLDIGQFLLPVGLLNETHEPDVFYGVERNPVEEFIIPATWWEKGVMVRTTLLPGLAVDVAVHNGLRGDINTLGSSDGLREFRQEFGGARAADMAYTLRVKYTGVTGLELGVAAQRQDNITQSQDLLTGGEAPAMLYEAHVDWHWKGFGLRGLYAQWDIDNDVAATNGTDKLNGFYIEPSWRATEKLGVFARYNVWNTAANMPAQKDDQQLNVGANYWLAPRVVLKADVQNTNQSGGAGDGFNLGIGLSF
jgi:hypothetical protein